MFDLISDWHNWKWVRHSGPAEFGPEGCPACEIKRLTAEVERTEERRLNLARGVAKYVTELAEKDAKIQRLESRGISDMQWELKEKDKRIEELEQDRERGLEERGYHIITTDQIDAAWKVATSEEPYADDCLAELGIVACEECGGSRVHRAWDFYPNEKPHDGQTLSFCESCHGHGWIITSVDVDKYGRIGTGEE